MNKKFKITEQTLKPKSSSYRQAASAQSVDDRLISLIRFLLALSALVIIYVDPTEPDRLVEITYTVLILYCLYSFVLYLLVVRFSTLSIKNFAHWIDLAWYLVFISLSSGTSSIFFYFFFFSILITSFRWGYFSGLLLTFVSAVLFTTIGYLTAPVEPAFELNRFLLRPVYLSILGYLIAYWGGREITSKKRLALLKNINKLANPRFGTDQTFELMMKRLLGFYEADSCLLITDISSPDGYSLREIDSNSNWTFDVNKTTSSLVELPENFGILYKDRSAFSLLEGKAERLNFETGKKEKVPKSNYKVLSDLLETPYFISVPVILHGEMFGRIYLTAQRNIFEASDLEFLAQAVEQILPTIQNIQLLDKMASVATVQQRRKISRDIHDSIVQPFIGLKLGLESLEIKYADETAVKNDIEQVTRLADSSINDLRKYIRKLNAADQADSTSVLLSAVKEQVTRFGELYDLLIDISADDNFYLSDRLSAEIFQIVVEGLSNIVRHTEAKKASLNFQRNSSIFTLEIKNDVAVKSESFFPKSIVGRVEDLGGQTEVIKGDDYTVILVEIPL